MNLIDSGGVQIPALGLGVMQMKGEEGEAMILEALGIGYRHLDTAAMYGNEPEVGRAIRASSVARGDIFLTTKIWRADIAAGDLQAAAEAALKRLNQDYVDLLLIHWPDENVPLADSLGALCEVKTRGLARAIGVANFPSAMFNEAQKLSSEPLATDQVEYHPQLSQGRLLETLRRHGSSLTAYCPLARGRLARDPVLTQIGQAHGATASQVALRWLVQQDRVIAIPKSSNPERLRQNFDIWGFTLTEDEMARVSALSAVNTRVVSPSFAPPWDAPMDLDDH